MRSVCRILCAGVVATSLVAPVSGEPGSGAARRSGRSDRAGKGKAGEGTARTGEAGKGESGRSSRPAKYEETVVVSASRASEKLVNAPATMSVVTSAQIEAAASPNFAELLRTVPGVNITQMSARDINVTTRGSTGTLATGQLALLDGRSLYQDFFGFVMWDLLPVNLNEVKQIEVIRGPASAVWGANAFNGVVNVITKSPREMQGTSAVLRVRRRSDRGQSRRADSGSLLVRQRHARAGDQRPMGLQAVGRRLFAGSVLASDGTDSVRPAPKSAAGLARPTRFCEPGQHAAEVRCARRLRLCRAARSCRSPAVWPAPTA